jgi:hypothetical protein
VTISWVGFLGCLLVAYLVGDAVATRRARRELTPVAKTISSGLFMSRALHQDLENIRPGAVEFISCNRTGSQWAILHRDDFEHILDVAGLKVQTRENP